MMPFDRRSLLTAAAAWPLAACVTQRATAPSRAIKLVTFNIWHDAGDWPTRKTLIVDVLRQADADVIALQEVLQDSGKQLSNQAETLAEMLGGYSVRFMSTSPEDAPNRYGNAILTRFPIIETDTKKLEPLNDYRTAIRLRVRSGSSFIDVVNTHLAYQADAGPVRTQQINDIIDWLPTDNIPLIVMGDFNAPLTEPALTPLRARGLISALPENSTKTTLVTSRGHESRVIDHIFVDNRHFTTTDSKIIGDQPVNGEYPSDHFGVATTLQPK